MTPFEVGILVAGGLTAGIVNTLAGGGSSLSVPLLVFLGLPGTVANGTNRVGVLAQNLAAAWSFRRGGLSGVQEALPLLVPVLLGSALGALLITEVRDQTFNQVFAVVMLALLLPMIRPTLEGFGLWRSTPDEALRAAPSPATPTSSHCSPGLRNAIFFCIGVYGGAIQAGVGFALLFALNRSGYDLVRSNAVKVIIVASLTLIAVPIFALKRQVDWMPALILALGFALGGLVGARLALRGGERLIRPVLMITVVLFAGRMLGIY